MNNFFTMKLLVDVITLQLTHVILVTTVISILY